MHRHSHALVLSVLLAASTGALGQSPAPAPAASARKLPPGIHEVEWSREGAATLKTQVTAGKFAEWCGKLRKGESVRWEFSSAETVDMNVHYHEGKDVHYPVKMDAIRKAEGTLVAPVDHEYCWMWTNKGSAASELTAQLRKQP